jgi:hypothetical protein
MSYNHTAKIVNEVEQFGTKVENHWKDYAIDCVFAYAEFVLTSHTPQSFTTFSLIRPSLDFQILLEKYTLPKAKQDVFNTNSFSLRMKTVKLDIRP